MAEEGRREQGPSRRFERPPRTGLARGEDLDRQLRATVDLAARLAGPDDVTKVAQAAVDAMVDAFGASRAEMWRAEGGTGLRLVASAGAAVPGAWVPTTLDVATDASLVAEVANTRLPVVSNEVVPPFAPALEGGAVAVAAAVLPALADDGGPTGGSRLLGVLAGWFPVPVPVETADLLGAFGAVVSGSLRHAELLDRERRRPAGTEGNAEALGREQRLRRFLDSVDAVLWEADPRTLQFTFVSRRAEHLLGYPVQRWLEPGFWSSAMHPADRDYALRYCQVAAAQGGDHDFEYRMVAADGREVWVQDLLHVEVDERGTPSRLVGVLLDITRRKRVDQALFESRERFASLARTLQASLLPPHLPEIFGVEVAARYRPAEDGVEVVGDFYDVFDVGDDGWGVVIGDVCGKGPEAAALTALARYTVRAAAIRERKPSRVLAMLSEAVLHQDSERYCTAAYARFAPKGGHVVLEVSCGGHPPPLVLRSDGTVERAGRPGTLLGLFDEVDLADEAVELRPGEAIVFFTDGATEARRRGECLGEQRLRALIATCAACPRAEDIADRVEDGVVGFQQGASQDDLAIVVLRVPG